MMDLGLTGKCLQSMQPGHTVILKLSDVYFISVESPLVVEVDGRSTSLLPEDNSEEALAPIRQLIGLMVEAAYADTLGGLDVTFEGGARLMVGPDPDYESWNVSGPDGALVVSMPGGGLAVWDTQPRGDDSAERPPAN